MTITDENGQEVNYTLSNGSRKVVIGHILKVVHFVFSVLQIIFLILII